MQKVEVSSPFIRFQKSPANRRDFVLGPRARLTRRKVSPDIVYGAVPTQAGRLACPRRIVDWCRSRAAIVLAPGRPPADSWDACLQLARLLQTHIAADTLRGPAASHVGGGFRGQMCLSGQR